MKRLVLDDIHGRTLITPPGFVIQLPPSGTMGVSMASGVPVYVAVSELVGTRLIDPEAEAEAKAERQRHTAVFLDNDPPKENP